MRQTRAPAPYEIWMVDGDNRISGTRAISADSDFAALDAALTCCGERKVEIWRDGRCVATLEKGALPLNVLWLGLW